VFFRGEKIGDVQLGEVSHWLYSSAANKREWVRLTRVRPQHDMVERFCRDLAPIRVSESAVDSSPQTEALVCARLSSASFRSTNGEAS
jgi:hypothetical protein